MCLMVEISSDLRQTDHWRWYFPSAAVHLGHYINAALPSLRSLSPKPSSSRAIGTLDDIARSRPSRHGTRIEAILTAGALASTARRLYKVWTGTYEVGAALKKVSSVTFARGEDQIRGPRVSQIKLDCDLHRTRKALQRTSK